MSRKEKSDTSFRSIVLGYQDKMSITSIVFLSLVSLLCAACNVAVPLLEKRLLEELDHTGDNAIWIMAIVAAGGCLFLILENFINVSVMLRFRRELENAMFDSLAFKEQPLIREKGVGVFAGASIGDSEQLARVLGAGWFSIGFNLIGAIISIVISATWKLYFLFIVLVAYALMLVVILVTNHFAVAYFRQEKQATYVLSADIREMADTHRSIFAYGSYQGYKGMLGEKRRLRDRYSLGSERALALGTALIRLITLMSLVALFFFAANELRGLPSPSVRAEEYPVIIALVGFSDAIFAPVGTLNSTYNLTLKFRAFYDPYMEYVAREALGELPQNLNLCLHKVDVIENASLILANVDLAVDKVYGVYGLEGSAKTHLISYLRGESYPVDGHIELGGARIYEIEKYLRLGLLTFNSAIGDLFGRDLEFNVTLGKTLVGDEEYDVLLSMYHEALREFFFLVDEGTLFQKQHRELAKKILGDFFAFDLVHLKSKTVQNEVFSSFRNIANREEFIDSVGSAVFARNYAKRSRYEELIRTLRIEWLEEREFGINGKKLTQAERALVLLARFLLPESKTPFVLLDFLEFVPVEEEPLVTEMLKKALKGRAGLLVSQDVDAVAAIADSIVVFNHGHLEAKGTHKEMLRKSKEYKLAFAASKAKPAKEEPPAPTKKKKGV